MSTYRSIQRGMKRDRRDGEDVFLLKFEDGSEKEIRAPKSDSSRLTWLLSLLDGSNENATDVHRCVSWTQSCLGAELELVRSQPYGEDYTTFRAAEAAEAQANRKRQLIELGLAEEEPLEEQPAAAEPDGTGTNLIEWPSPSEGIN